MDKEGWRKEIKKEGFVNKFCTPKHVGLVLPERPGQVALFWGLDGTTKTYDQLTDEELADWKEQCSEIPRRINEKYRERTRRINNKGENKNGSKTLQSIYTIKKKYDSF